MKKISYTQFKNIHSGACLILALGKSIDSLKKDIADKYICIGINDIYRYGFTPKYMVLLDYLKRYSDYGNLQKKIECIANSKSEYCFTQFPFDFEYAKNIKIPIENLSNHNANDIMNRGNLFAYHTSTITAISLAIYMGFKQIGIIGFDLLDHAMEKDSSTINKYCEKINEYCRTIGVEILNLSKDSLITAFNTVTIQQFNEWYGGSDE